MERILARGRLVGQASRTTPATNQTIVAKPVQHGQTNAAQPPDTRRPFLCSRPRSSLSQAHRTYKPSISLLLQLAGPSVIGVRAVRTRDRRRLSSHDRCQADRDPTAAARSYRTKEIHTWNEEEIAIFEKRWAEGSRERLAFALLLYTGQRGSDVHRMLWANYIGDSIRVAPQKTATKLTIPIHESLARLLATANRSHPTILVTAFKKPFSVKGFGNMMSNAIDEAGLPSRCKPQGLRKAAARRLAEAGCSASEIMSITGHKTLAEVERYTRAAEQEQLARRAIKRQSENKSGKLEPEKVANSDELIEIASLIGNVALPTGIEPVFQP